MDSPVSHDVQSPRSRKVKEARRRRMSVVDKFAMTEKYIRDNFRQLTEIWDEVEMPEEMRYERTKSAFKHIENLVDQLVESEEQMLVGVKEGIRDGLLKIEQLSVVLELPPWKSTLKNPSISLRRTVNHKVTELTELFEEKKSVQLRTYTCLTNLARKLDELTELEDVCDDDKLLSDEQLNLWNARILQMETTLSSRAKLARDLQVDLRKWAAVLPECTDDVRLLCKLDFDAEDAVFSSSLVSSISDNHSEMQEIYNEWISSKKFSWDSDHETIVELWDKCHVPLEDRKFLSEYDPIVCNFEEIKSEIQRLECLYAARKGVYDLIQQFKENWNKKVELEQKKKDPNYYKCREKGHNVTNDLKLEKSLNTCVERLTAEIAAEYSKYQESHPNDSISIEGFSPVTYIEWIRQEYISSSEKEKREKQVRRKLENATRSPLRSRCATPQPQAKKPNPNSTLRPLFQSAGREPSIIQPTRSQINGPKTSSPKRVKVEAVSLTPQKTLCRPPLSTPRRKL